jgi:hypothetical protein
MSTTYIPLTFDAIEANGGTLPKGTTIYVGLEEFQPVMPENYLLHLLYAPQEIVLLDLSERRSLWFNNDGVSRYSNWALMYPTPVRLVVVCLTPEKSCRTRCNVYGSRTSDIFGSVEEAREWVETYKKQLIIGHNTQFRILNLDDPSWVEPE